jgi:hypothetical protein
MTKVRCVVLLVAALSAASAAAAQEWKTAPPTAADWAAVAKLPDFTGVWEAPTVGRGGAAGGAGARAGGPPPVPQLTPAYAARKRELDAKNTDDTEAANCLPTGMPAIMGHPYPYEFLTTPGKVTIVAEAYMQVRHIYTDGRPLPADPDPTFNGTSIGRWEGDTLVVESIGFSPLVTIARNTPHSGRMRIVERFRLTAPDTMTVQTTVTDPEALTAPWTTTRTWARQRAWTIREYICEENNRNFIDSSGKAGVVLDNPGGAPAQKE